MDVRVVVSDEVGYIKFCVEIFDVLDIEYYDVDEYNV